MVAARAIESVRQRGVGGDRGQAGARRVGHLIEREPVGARMFQRPQRQHQIGRRRLQQWREEDVEGAEADAVLPELATRRLVERLDLLGDGLALQGAEVLDEPEGDATGEPLHVLGGGEFGERLQLLADHLRHPRLQPRLDLLAVGGRKLLVGEQRHLRFQRIGAGLDLGHLLVAPQQAAGARQLEGIRLGGGDAAGAHAEFPRQHLRGGVARRLAVDAVAHGVGIGLETEALDRADLVVLDADRAVVADLGVELFLVSHTLHQCACPSIDEPLRETLVESVGETVFDGARAALPVRRVGEPVGAVGDKRPGADVRDTVGERIDVAIGAVRELDLLGEPILGDALGAGAQELVERADQLGVVVGRDLAVVGNLADLPQPQNGGGRGGEIGDLAVGGDRLQCQHVVGHAGAYQPLLARHLAQAVAQAVERLEIEVTVAPLQHAHAVEVVRLEPLHQLRLQRIDAARHAEGAVVHVAAGAAGDLGQLGRRQVAVRLAVELAHARERDVIDVEVQAHADGVGGDDEADIARLVEFDLGVAGARRQRAEHDRRAATLAADQLGDGIDVVGREGDHGRARRQAGDFLLAGVGEARQARPRDEIGARNEIGDRFAHGLGAEQQRLGAAARVEQAIGEDVAALGIGAELDLVDGEEVDVDVARHRLDGADPVARPLRLDLLLARDEGHLVDADAGGDAVIDLARQQPQRQPDHAALVAEHALDGEMRLAGIRRAEHRGDVPDARFEIAGHVGRNSSWAGCAPTSGRRNPLGHVDCTSKASDQGFRASRAGKIACRPGIGAATIRRHLPKMHVIGAFPRSGPAIAIARVGSPGRVNPSAQWHRSRATGSRPAAPSAPPSRAPWAP